jgi:hypothetical protein
VKVMLQVHHGPRESFPDFRRSLDVPTAEQVKAFDTLGVDSMFAFYSSSLNQISRVSSSGLQSAVTLPVGLVQINRPW